MMDVRTKDGMNQCCSWFSSHRNGSDRSKRIKRFSRVIVEIKIGSKKKKKRLNTEGKSIKQQDQEMGKN